MKENTTLLEIYESSIKMFNETGYHLHPANLLSLLVISEKDNFEALPVSEGKFYEAYKNILDKKINKVIHDFKIGIEEIENFIELNGISTDDFEFDKIWFVFAEGFGVMHGEMMYRPNQTEQQIYNCMENKFEYYKHTKDGLIEYHTKDKEKLLTKK